MNDIIHDFNISMNESEVYEEEVYNCAYLDDNEFSQFAFWTTGVLLNLVGLFGIVGNIMSMMVLSRPKMKSSINSLFFGLAICDTALIVSSSLHLSIESLYHVIPNHYFRFFAYRVGPLLRDEYLLDSFQLASVCKFA